MPEGFQKCTGCYDGDVRMFKVFYVPGYDDLNITALLCGEVLNRIFKICKV